MISHAVPAPRVVLADSLISRSIATDVVLVAGGAGLTAVLAQVSVPVWPVPITGQTLAVLLVGSTLGATRGALSMLLYAVLGMLGAPVFAEAGHGVGVVLGASGGYIVGFVFAAAAVGALAERGRDRRFRTALLSFAAGTLITFGVGMPWLAISMGADLRQTLEWGLYPFIVGGVVKALLAAAAMPVAWRLASRWQARK